ncbi:MAG: chromosome segregation protein SMC [Desulfomonilaceae bacterium]|nr:chromosome segregation protein SMC [Desulfomonilaceae bacterium]
MKIKRLEIKGFKSFPDKTVLEIKPGITAVVGPNGCGKSNVMEAIRWVMGEQRAKSLRGKKMEDVIFNGSENRKPVGMAEVRLVLAAAEGFPNPSMADYDEVMITRRLFRDGDSQYEINNVACRLSDITDFFLDTGVGRNSYAIIEQGRVDLVVASKPEDRRVLIEEAAGINRYKSRREAALKKLELTNQNLQRIGDVIGEVRRRHASLKRQAAKAERYRKLSERLRELDVSLHAFRCRAVEDRLAEVNRELERNRSLLEDSESDLAAVNAELEAKRLQALETEKDYKTLLEERHGIDIELTSIRGRIEKDEGRIAQLKDRGNRLQEDRIAAEEELRDFRATRDALETDRTSVAEDLSTARTRLEQVLGEMRERDESLKRESKRLETLKDDIFRTLQESAQGRNRRDGLKKRAAEIETELRRVGQDAVRTEESMARDRAERERLTRDVEDLEKLKLDSHARKQGLTDSLKSTRKRISELTHDLADHEKLLAAHRARLESMEEMQRSFQGYDQGVRFLMKERESNETKDLLGPLAEMIEVPPRYERALAAALGNRLGHLVVSSPRDAVYAVNRLKEAGAGRSTFIPVSPRPASEARNGDTLEGTTSLREVVKFREGYENLGDFLLRRCFVVDDIHQAVEIWEKNGVQVDLVTTAGELINRYGEITGGSQDKEHERVFEKRRKISELKQTIASLEHTVPALGASLNEQEAVAERLASEIDEEMRVTNDLTMQQVRLKKDLERIEAQLSTSERRSQVIGLETERLIGEQDGLSVDMRKAEAMVAAQEAGLAELEKEREEVGRQVDKLTEAAREEAGRTGEIRVHVAQLEERHRSLEREYRSVTARGDHLDKRIAHLKEEVEQSAAEHTRLRTAVEEARSREKELMQLHSTQAGRLEFLMTRSAELARSVRDLDADSNSKGKAVQTLREVVHGLEVESVKMEQTLEGLVEKTIDRHHVDPRTVPYPESPPQEAEVTNIREQLEALGDVNLAAIAERTETEERLTFLQEQQADLKKAVESLYETIGKINRTTRERFRAAFDSVNEKFQEIFPFLFRGGEARLELTDERDLLETGVDIMARLPGKRKQNMDLLSGGEKALTAVALIFSIFLTRPSPFCLLDEVDAPLDDANLARFNEMIRDLSNRTQFLIITHNKRSMEEADSLYGVTMEEPGASSVVSVKFMD